ELPDRNPHAIGAEVAQAEDPFTVGDDDDPPVRIGPVPQHLGDAPAITGADEDPPGPLEDAAELLAGEAHGRRVDDRQRLVRVVRGGAEEECLVAVVQGVQVDVLLEIRRLAAKFSSTRACCSSCESTWGAGDREAPANPSRPR